MRVDLGAGFGWGRYRRVVGCPAGYEDACATWTGPTSLRTWDVVSSVLNPAITIGLTRDWQLTLATPAELRHVRLQATETEAGDAGIVAGPTDGRLMVQGFTALAQGWIVGGGLGLSLPIGHPGRGGVAGAPSRLGSGGFDPLLSARLLTTEGKVGLFVSADARIGLFEAEDGFTPPTSVSASAGVLWRPNVAFTASATLDYQHDTPMKFWGRPAEDHHEQGGVAVGIYPEFRPGLVGQLLVRALPLTSRHGDSLASQPVSVVAGLSWTFDLLDPPKP